MKNVLKHDFSKKEYREVRAPIRGMKIGNSTTNPSQLN
jgi:hypothetical protein